MRIPVGSDTSAGVAELEDAPGLGPGGLTPLEVRVLSPAHATEPADGAEGLRARRALRGGAGVRLRRGGRAAGGGSRPGPRRVRRDPVAGRSVRAGLVL